MIFHIALIFVCLLIVTSIVFYVGIQFGFKIILRLIANNNEEWHRIIDILDINKAKTRTENDIKELTSLIKKSCRKIIKGS